MRGISVSTPGGPEVMQYVQIERPKPGPGDALVRVEAIGVNYLDVYHRTGVYPLPTPFTPGSEAAGVVEEVGSEVTHASVGDRVCYSHIGTYAEYTVVPAAKLVPVPEGIDSGTAAAAFLQGVTAQYLSNSTFPIKAGDTVLIHAAAGGVGGILVQMAKRLGAYVYGTASTGKLDLVREAGADVVIDYTREDFEAIVMEKTGGAGLDAVYDSVGATTFDQSLNCLATRGMLVLFGQSSGPVAPFDVARLAKKSAFLTRPSLAHHIAGREELLWRASELFATILDRSVNVRIQSEMPLANAGEAHTLLESRKTAGKLVLIP